VHFKTFFLSQNLPGSRVGPHWRKVFFLLDGGKFFLAGFPISDLGGRLLVGWPFSYLC